MGFWHFLAKTTIIFFIFCMMIEANTVQLLALVPCFKKNNPGSSRGSSVKNRIFNIFLETLLWIFLTFCMMIETITLQHLDKGSGFKKIIQVSKGLSVKKLCFSTFSWERYYKFFWFLHDDRGQHYATSDLAVQFQKKLSLD